MTTTTTATIILQQLGGSRFIAMTGATNLLDLGNGIQMKIGRGALDGITHVRVVLNARDLYDISFERCAKKAGVMTVTAKGECGDVGVENLGELFTRQTGFLLSL